MLDAIKLSNFPLPWLHYGNRRRNVWVLIVQ